MTAEVVIDLMNIGLREASYVFGVGMIVYLAWEGVRHLLRRWQERGEDRD